MLDGPVLTRGVTSPNNRQRRLELLGLEQAPSRQSDRPRSGADEVRFKRGCSAQLQVPNCFGCWNDPSHTTERRSLFRVGRFFSRCGEISNRKLPNRLPASNSLLQHQWVSAGERSNPGPSLRHYWLTRLWALRGGDARAGSACSWPIRACGEFEQRPPLRPAHACGQSACISLGPAVLLSVLSTHALSPSHRCFSGTKGLLPG